MPRFDRTVARILIMRQKGSKPPDNWHRLVKPLQPTPRWFQVMPLGTRSIIDFAQKRKQTTCRQPHRTEIVVAVYFTVAFSVTARKIGIADCVT